MLFVIGGLVTVGTSDMVTQKPCNTTTTNTSTFSAFSYASVSVHKNDCKNDTTSIFVGDLLIFSSQVIVATQMVLEEKFVTKYNVPALQAVGWEGTFGFTTLSLLLIPFSFIYVGESFGHGPRYGAITILLKGIEILIHLLQFWRTPMMPSTSWHTIPFCYWLTLVKRKKILI